MSRRASEPEARAREDIPTERISSLARASGSEARHTPAAASDSYHSRYGVFTASRRL